MMVRETGHGPAVHFFLFRAKLVLIEKYGEPLVKAGIVGIAVDLAGAAHPAPAGSVSFATKRAR